MNGAPVGRIISSTGLTTNPVISGIDSSALHDSGFGGSFISSTGRGSFGGSSISGGSSQSGGSSGGGMNGYPLPPLPDTPPNIKQFDPVGHQFSRGSPTNRHQQYLPQHHPQNHLQHHVQNHQQHHPQNHLQHHPQNHQQHHPQNHQQHHPQPSHMNHFHHTAPQYPMPSHIQSGIPPPLPPYNNHSPMHSQMNQQELPPDINTHHQLHARSSGSSVRRSSVSSQDLALRNPLLPQEFSGGDCKQNLPINNNITSSNKVFDTIDLLQSANHKHSTDDEILREAFMVKRSQNKSRFGPTNWRERWFVLTPAHLIYFDGDKQSGRKKEKGRVDLSSVEYVERVDDNVFDRQHVIQIAHILSCSESGPQTINCTLYIEATTQLDATSWMQHIRTLIANNSSLSSHYHPGRPQRGASWACCKSATPCTPITWSPSNQPQSPCLSPPTPHLRGVHQPGEIVKHQRQQSSTSSHCSILTTNSAASPPPSLALSVDMIGGSLAALDTGSNNATNSLGSPDSPQKRLVRALYDYKAAQKGDLSLVQDEEYEVLEETEEHWWKLKDKHGNEGYSPSNYVKVCTDIGLHQYDWYLGDATRQRAETILMREEREGCFVVRNSTSTSGMYTISVYCSMSRPQVKHYHIQKDGDCKYYLSQNIKCNSIAELIYKHQYNPGGLCTRLRSAPHGNKPPATAGFGRDKWDIPLTEITLMEEIGSGQFGVVKRGRYRNMDVAVKMMKEGTMSEDEFIEEAKVMTKLQHPNLVQLYGVCRRQRPVYIITEFLEYGSLLHYLRQKEKSLITKTDTLVDMCLQIADGMAYLEKEKFIHRDLAARNCLVGSKNIKVGDFGLARYVVDDEYTGSGGAKFPIKWAAPEVLNYMRFSSKSDVWAFGVLMWEVFTCGKMPYGRRKNADVVAMVQEGIVLDQPRYCPNNVYQVMRECWEQTADQRPTFTHLRDELTSLNSEDC